MRIGLIIACLFVLLLPSCFEEDTFSDNSKKGNFEALWKIIDEHYCFFGDKGIDWNEVHDRYSDRIVENMSNDALFSVLAEMLSELKDGHVNLAATHDLGRNWSWYEDFPRNFDEIVIYNKNYLSTDYSIASGLKYKVLDDNIGYIYYESFSDGIGEGNLDQVISRLSSCDGIIIDVRNNGGGLLTNSDKLASRFFNEKTLVGYIRHKTGKGHNDFSEPYARYIEPSNRLRYQKQVMVLTNRRSYSSTNDFVNAMKYAPNAKIVGDNTGGGSGLPFSSEIPNGWSVRLSASPMYNADMEHLEFGIAPDIKAEVDENDRSRDAIIERAREEINKKTH